MKKTAAQVASAAMNRARTKKVTPERRKEIAQLAGRARWTKSEAEKKNESAE